MNNLTPHQRAHRSTVERGINSGRTPLGYRRLKPGLPPVPNPHVAPLLAEAVARIIEGQSMTAVAGWLAEMGVRSSLGNPISRVSLDRTMRSGFWAGFIQFKGERLQGAHEPIIPRHMQDDLDQELACRVGWNSTHGPAKSHAGEVSSEVVDATEGHQP